MNGLDFPFTLFVVLIIMIIKRSAQGNLTKRGRVAIRKHGFTLIISTMYTSLIISFNKDTGVAGLIVTAGCIPASRICCTTPVSYTHLYRLVPNLEFMNIIVTRINPLHSLLLPHFRRKDVYKRQPLSHVSRN